MRRRAGIVALAFGAAAWIGGLRTAAQEAEQTPTNAKFGFGRAASAADIAARDVTVLPDGTGLPEGKGTAAQGRVVFTENCAVCHNDNAEGREGQYVALAGGMGTLGTPRELKTVNSYWPYATTLFDYIRRAMPYDNPRTLSNDQVYSVAAFILSLDGIVEEDQELNARTLPQVRMPNRDGFIADPRPDVGPAANPAQ